MDDTDKAYWAKVEALWEKYDADRSGVLEWDEAVLFLEQSIKNSSGEAWVPMSQIRSMFDEIDEDGNGVLDKVEVFKYLKGFELGS